jgi:hypothetical protein
MCRILIFGCFFFIVFCQSFFFAHFCFFLLSVLLSFLLLSNWFLFLSFFIFPLLFWHYFIPVSLVNMVSSLTYPTCLRLKSLIVVVVHDHKSCPTQHHKIHSSRGHVPCTGLANPSSWPRRWCHHRSPHPWP